MIRPTSLSQGGVDFFLHGMVGFARPASQQAFAQVEICVLAGFNRDITITAGHKREIAVNANFDVERVVDAGVPEC